MAESESPQKVRTRTSNWSHAETLRLIRSIGQRDTQTALKNNVHTRYIWDDIAAKLKSGRSGEQCHDRWRYLQRRYREAMVKRQTDRSYTCNFFKELNTVLGRRTPGNSRAAAPPTAVASTSPRAASSDRALRDETRRTPAAPSPPEQAPVAAPSLPEVPDSDYDENEDDDEEEEDEEDVVGDLDDADENDIRDLFAQNQTHGQDIDYSADMSDDMGNKTAERPYTSYNPTAATNSAKPVKRAAAAASSHQPQPQPPKKARGRPKSSAAPPRDDMTVAQAITDAVLRFIDHQSHHLAQQTQLMQRYLKFERARMRWEMEMETRRMKWEEEREMREEERRQRQEEQQSKRVSDNREFMLQMAVVLGNRAVASGVTVKDSTEN